MKEKLKALEESVSLADAERLSDELASFDDKYSLAQDAQQRILSSVMRKAGFEMDKTIQIKRTKRDKTDSDRARVAEVSRARHGVAIAACLAVAVTGAVAAGLIFGRGVDIDQQEKPKSSLVTDTADSGKRKVQEWAKPYLEQNPETVGYLKIKGLRDDGDLESPVVQHEDNEYYFSHGFDNEPCESGVIFADCTVPINENGQPSNIILYGQNMRVNSDNADDVMFSSLLKYKDSTFFDTHQIIDFCTVYDDLDTRYQIIACFSIDLDYEKYESGTDFEYWRYRNFDDEFDFDTWSAKLKEYSINTTDTDFTEKDEYITLSTAYGYNSRFAVVAKKITKAENTSDEVSSETESSQHRDLDYDEEKQQYYDVNTGEYLTDEEFQEYWEEIEMIMNDIGDLDKEDALKLLEGSSVEYEIHEPGQSVDVEIGHEYMIFFSHDRGLQIYFSRKVDGLPEAESPYSDEAKRIYEKAGFKVLDLYDPHGGWSEIPDKGETYYRVICEDYIKPPEQVAEEITGLTKDKAEDIVCGAGFFFNCEYGGPSEYDAGRVYKTEFSDGSMTCYLSSGNKNKKLAEVSVPIPEGGLKGSYTFSIRYENEEGIYDGSPEPLFIAGKSVTDPEGGTEVKLEFEEKVPMFFTVRVEKQAAPGEMPVSIGYAEYYVENGKVTLLGDPYTEGLKELNDL